MSDESPLPIIVNLTEAEFSKAVHIRLYPLVEDFVVTQIGRKRYAVSMAHGYAYTRRQLIQKYSLVLATYLVTKQAE
jgi:hypothetical protein